MAPDRGACSQGQWAFVITSPAELYPNTEQRTVMRRHVMRDIGYSRRKRNIKRPQQKSDSASSASSGDGTGTAILQSLEPVVISLLPMDPESQQMLRHSIPPLPISSTLYVVTFRRQ